MSDQLSLPVPRTRNSEDKLYQACLAVCIEGIEKLSVDTRRGIVSIELDENNDPTSAPAFTHLILNRRSSDLSHSHSLTLHRTRARPGPFESENPLTSPSVPLRKSNSQTPLRSALAAVHMDRAPLHGGPIRGQAPSRKSRRDITPVFDTQDARSNFAVQPAANASVSGIKLKRAAVKIVGAAAPTAPPSTPFRGAASPHAILPAPSPVKAEAKIFERVGPAKSVTNSYFPAKSSKSTPSNVESSASDSAQESELDSMFARLSTGGFFKVSSSKTAVVSGGPEASAFSFENRLNEKETNPQVTRGVITAPAEANETVSVSVRVSQEKEAAKTKEVETTKYTKYISQRDLEQLYLRKAIEYVSALPASNNVSVQTIKIVSDKMHKTYAPSAKLSIDEAESLKKRYVFAIVNYINQVLKKTATPVKADDVKMALQDCDGNILALYGALVSKGHLALDDIDDVTGLFKMIQDVLPKAEPGAASTATWSESTTTAAAATAAGSKAASKDPIDKMTAWPVQEKREAPAQHRACILKGVSNVKSVNELQALVWGGRLESIAMPSLGSDFAVVRFLTPEACEKYFKATENGIETRDGLKKAVIFVEKQPGPTSINDVMRNCIEGDASRCVRALDAEEDWSDILLTRLACGKGMAKRELDRIKRGKTADGRHFIEFRFANIYHALNFKKVLMDDADWEHCTVSYATDPCETAQGIHYKDQDE